MILYCRSRDHASHRIGAGGLGGARLPEPPARGAGKIRGGTHLLSRALPSKTRLVSFSSSVSITRAAFLILERASWTLQSSRLLRRPYSPTIFSSESRRSFSKGRLGLLKDLL